jgi:putative GTP pyrophosphokinase
MSERSFPGGSKSRVNAAGDAVRRGSPSEDDFRVIDEWRSAHTAVINTFQALLRNRAKAVGQSLHTARFAHTLRNDADKYNYIKKPKADGYRGQGLNIELQYRTLTQHTWSTTVEILSHVTGHEPEYHRGDPRYVEAMALASEMFARTFESANGPRPSLPDAEVARRFLQLDGELGLLLRLKTLQVADRSKGTGSRHFVLMRGGYWNSYLSVSNYATDEAAKQDLAWHPPAPAPRSRCARSCSPS